VQIDGLTGGPPLTPSERGKLGGGYIASCLGERGGGQGNGRERREGVSSPRPRSRCGGARTRRNEGSFFKIKAAALERTTREGGAEVASSAAFVTAALKDALVKVTWLAEEVVARDVFAVDLQSFVQGGGWLLLR
jgi:hypothetical protein